jgi:hypothetical protein
MSPANSGRGGSNHPATSTGRTKARINSRGSGCAHRAVHPHRRPSDPQADPVRFRINLVAGLEFAGAEARATCRLDRPRSSRAARSLSQRLARMAGKRRSKLASRGLLMSSRIPPAGQWQVRQGIRWIEHQRDDLQGAGRAHGMGRWISVRRWWALRLIPRAFRLLVCTCSLGSTTFM